MNRKLLSEFLRLSDERTTIHNKETMGLFFGKLVPKEYGRVSQYEITQLIIPTQTYSDDCNGLVNWLPEYYGLKPLGWIQTQLDNDDAHLTSNDLHTALHKQENIRSAVNIVYSRKTDSFSAFHLMLYKVDEIKACTDLGHFFIDHKNAYCNSDHITITSDTSFKIFNLLNKDEFNDLKRRKFVHHINNFENQNKSLILKNKINYDCNNNSGLNNAKLSFINDMNVLNYNGDEEINNFNKLQKKKKKIIMIVIMMKKTIPKNTIVMKMKSKIIIIVFNRFSEKMKMMHH